MTPPDLNACNRQDEPLTSGSVELEASQATGDVQNAVKKLRRKSNGVRLYNHNILSFEPTPFCNILVPTLQISGILSQSLVVGGGLSPKLAVYPLSR